MDAVPPGYDLSLIPAGPAPPGETSNLIDPESHAWVARLCVYISLPIMIIVLALRMIARQRTKQWGIDDYLCIFAAVITTLFCAFLVRQYSNPVYGRHFWDIPLSALDFDYMGMLVIVLVLYAMAAMFTKISLFALYLRIFSPSKASKRMIWGGLIVISIFYTVSALITLIYCVPHPGDGGWGSTKSLTRCATPQMQITAASGVVGTVTDFYVMAIPLARVLQLKLTPKKKFAIAGIFLTGLLACAFSIVGVWTRFVLLDATTPDYTWLSATAQGLSAIELNIGLICCCLPLLPVVFKSLPGKGNGFWGTIKLYMSSRTRKTYESGDSSSPSGKPATDPSIEEGTPVSQRSRVSSYFRKEPRTQLAGSPDKYDSHNARAYYELRSVELDYHEHLKEGSTQHQQVDV